MTRPLTSLAAAALAATICHAQTTQPHVASPDQTVIAVVLGEQITAADADHLDGMIFSALLKKYARDNKLEPTENEIEAHVRAARKFRRQHRAQLETDIRRLREELKSSSLSAAERARKSSRLETCESLRKTDREMDARARADVQRSRQIRREVSRMAVQDWKLKNALYKQYGGGVVFQQAGPEPLDAYYAFLKEKEKKGAFEIFDKKYEPKFWDYFDGTVAHSYYPEDVGARYMSTPWWLRDKSPED